MSGSFGNNLSFLLFSENVFFIKISYGHKECNLMMLPKTLKWKDGNVLLNVQKKWWETTKIYSNILFFLKMILWTRRTQFWQLQRKFLAKKPKPIALCPKRLRTFFLQKKCFSSNCSYGHLDSRFGNPAKKFLPESQNFLAQRRRRIKIIYLFVEKIILPQKHLMDT